MGVWVGGVEVTNASGVYVGGTLCAGVYVGDVKVWPTFNPTQVGPFTTSGSYTVPVGASKCDVIVFGGGAGGDLGGAGNRGGYGGLPGEKKGLTVSVTPGASISYTVGSGGKGGFGSGLSSTAPTPGTSTSCSGVVAAGGAIRQSGVGQDCTGLGTGDLTFNGRVYPGSANVGTIYGGQPGLNGAAPGGGGEGGKGVITGYSTGGNGAAGCVYLYFY